MKMNKLQNFNIKITINKNKYNNNKLKKMVLIKNNKIQKILHQIKLKKMNKFNKYNNKIIQMNLKILKVKNLFNNYYLIECKKLFPNKIYLQKIYNKI